MITGKAWGDINTLLAYLRGQPTVVELVDKYYGQFGNHAPAELLERQIEKVQKHLDEGQSQYYADKSL